ncbi:MAG: metallophosphoesterase family protein [Chloroflexi bacterium]|nr:MAG: metallophosphoesterase family protein [Chloroflexota bacterium]
MRVAVISDIHGNLPALEAVLSDVSRARVDLIISCGDVASGPLPVETLQVLRGLADARFVRGNADRALVAGFDGSQMPRLKGPGFDWCSSQLTREDRDFLASFAETITIDVDGLGRVLFCHGSPRSDEEIMTARTSEERLGEFVAGVDAAVVVCGHTHMPFDRMAGRVRVINPGSVGMPYGEPGAFWAVLGPEIAFRRTDYDRPAAADRIRKSAWLEANEFARENVLTVPTIEDAMAFLTKAGGP